MPGTLLAQQVEQALDFPAQKRGIEFGGSGGLHLYGGFIQPCARAADGESLFVEKLADTADEQYFMVLVVTAVAAPLDWFELGKFLLPVTQYMRFHAAKLAYFTDGEVTLGGNRGQRCPRTAAVAAAVHRSSSRPSPSVSGWHEMSRHDVP